MKLLFSCILFLTTGSLLAQTQQQLDSLERLLPRKKGKEKVQLLNDLTFYYFRADAKKAIAFGSQSLKLAQTLNDETILANTYNDYSMPFLTTGNFQKSVELNTKALEIRTRLKDTSGMISSYAKLGNGHFELGQYKKAQQAYNKAIYFAKILGDENTLLQLYQNSANVLEVSGFIKEALKMQLDVHEIALRTDNKLVQLSNYGNLGSCYQKLKQYEKAREMYLKAIPLARETNQSEQLAMVYQGLGVVERAAGNTDLGLKYYQQAFQLYKRLDSKTGEGIIAVNIGNSFADLKQPDSAAFYLNLGLQLVKDTKSYRQIMNAYRGLSELELSRKNYQKAAEYLVLQNKYQDSVTIFQGNELIADVFGKYELEKNQRALAESKAKNAKNQLYQAIWIGISATLLLLFVIVFLFFRHKRKIAKEELVRTKQEEQYLREKQLNEQKLSISRELHDNVGSQITYLISSIDNLSYMDEENEVLNTKLQDLSNFGRNTMQELRSTIWAMNSEDGSIETLLTRIESIRNKIPLSIEIHTKLDQNHPLKSTELLNLYRIIQEAIQNTLKHAQATCIRITLEEKENRVKLTITDDGKGVQTGNAQGNGLQNMRHRCEQIGGEFQLNTSEKEGTAISCTFVI
ncbi:tetratricopeptide repeat-containing sensor histidine kinase [Fluviicola chungangensis]|uniref:histidine kinase n=1 Tax=Fluviicola chungangensis TaxID=2597671 RepID=A0A556MJG1_9FLAO|nr:sensor histidine kinase [Fluviicola chungangensis]TSJ40047.1 tetratricopeptide repeat protein [Fluviicola chungangensis]